MSIKPIYNSVAPMSQRLTHVFTQKNRDCSEKNFLDILKDVDRIHLGSTGLQEDFTQKSSTEYRDIIAKIERSSITRDFVIQFNNRIVAGLEKIFNTQI